MELICKLCYYSEVESGDLIVHECGKVMLEKIKPQKDHELMLKSSNSWSILYVAYDESA